MFTLEARFTAHKLIVGRFQCLIPADQTIGPTPQQIKSIQVLEKFYKHNSTKPSEELAPEPILWYKKISRLNAAERPIDALSSIKEYSSDTFPNIFILMIILLSSKCIIKQSFSTLCRLKTFLQNTTGTTQMNGFTLLNIYRNHTPCHDDVISRLSGRNRGF